MAPPRDEPPADKAHKPKGAGWLSRLRPGLNRTPAAKPNDTPDNLWLKDPETGEMLYQPDLEAALWVTPSGHHLRISPTQRFGITFD